MSDINRFIFRRLLPLAAAGLCLLSLIPVGALRLSDSGDPVGGGASLARFLPSDSGMKRPVEPDPPQKPQLPDPERPVFLRLPNGRAALLERYEAWSAEYPEAAPEEVVLQVNMGLDKPFYSQVEILSDPASVTALVNKYNALPASYVPELETLGQGYGSGSMRPEAAQAFRSMADKAREEGISLRSVSAYRSYQLQKSAYSGYRKNASQAYVDTFSARAGHSEHQTGLAVDINAASRKASFEKTPAFAWLKEHCAEYGFILRYDEDKQPITGYRFEPWHYRYVGVEAAQACMSQGLCYEEYLALLPG